MIAPYEMRGYEFEGGALRATFERSISVGGILCAVTWPGHDQHALCPNPFCDGYGNIDVSVKGNGKAWIRNRCEVGPHLLSPETVEAISKSIRWLREMVASGRIALPWSYTDHALDKMWRESFGLPSWDGYYEAPNGDEIPFYRCDGSLVCWDCWRTYSRHARDEREECLTVLCNGWRVKL